MRRTLKEHFSVSGTGIHTGKHTTLEVLPSFDEKGIYFYYQDLSDPVQEYIPCHLANVVSTQRCTVLGNGRRTVSTVEHLLSVLHANGITDARLEIDGPEVPILDGSGHIYQGLIDQSGLQEYEGDDWEVLIIDEPLEFHCKESGAHYSVDPSDQYELEVILKYDNAVLGEMEAHWIYGDDFGNNIAPARTFSLFSEIAGLMKSGMIQGGSFKNAIVIQDDDISSEEIKTEIHKYIPDSSDVSVRNQVVNGPLLFPNEPARHKILDMLGDLSLLNRYIKGRIRAIRPGHTGNYNFARYLINSFYG